MLQPVPSSRLLRGGLALLVVAGLAALGACGLDLQGLGDAPGDDASSGHDGTVGDASGEVGVDGSGGGDVAPDDAADAAGDGSGDAREAGAEGGDAAFDGDATGDVADAPVDACDGSAVEVCTNGIDDNCNGLVDCADPQCATQGFGCMPAVPPGWALVAYTESARPSCPAGWGSSAPVVEGPDGGGACQCTCGVPLGNACVQGTLSMSLGQTQCGCGQVQDVPLVSNGLCDPVNHAIGTPCGPWGDGKVTPPAPASVACSQTTALPPVTYAAQGETCAALGSAGAGCSAGGGCLPRPVPALACVERAGLQASCPPGFTQLHVVYAPSDVVDQRGCSSCGCASSPTSCAGGTLTLYDDPGCGKSAATLPADGNCNSMSGDPADAGWFIYSATPNTTACAGASTSALDGGLAVHNPTTICCP